MTPGIGSPRAARRAAHTPRRGTHARERAQQCAPLFRQRSGQHRGGRGRLGGGEGVEQGPASHLLDDAEGEFQVVGRPGLLERIEQESREAQIGKNVRLAVINTKNGRIFLINPKITKKSLLKEWGEEGCLSVPGVFGQVKRHKKITCEYLDQKSVENAIKAEGLLARVIQHEIDHLDGILFIDKAKNLKHDRITTLPKGA